MDIIYLNITDTEVVVLNSLSAANELLDRRSLKYSSRYVDLPCPIALRVHFPIAISPQFVMVNDLMGWSWSFASMIYGDSWREQASTLHQVLSPQ